MTAPNASALVAVFAPVEKAAQAETPGALSLATMVGSFVIRSDDDFAFAAKLLASIKADWKRRDEERKSVTGPLTNVTRTVNSWFKPASDALEKAERDIKAKMVVWTNERQAERVAAMVANVAPEPPPEAEGVSFRTRRAWRVIDEERVPRAFCSVDTAKIGEHLRNGGLEAIPGIEFYDETIVASRGAR